MDPKKVLVVDDSRLMHKMYEVMLRQYMLVHAYDGQEAVEEMERHEVDLVLLDINMPTMNGLEFLQAKNYAGDPTLPPAIIISTEGKEEDTVRGLKAGAAAYIKKPFSSVELVDVIARLPSRDEPTGPGDGTGTARGER